MRARAVGGAQSNEAMMSKFLSVLGRVLALVVVLIVIGCGTTEPSGSDELVFVIRDGPCDVPAEPDSLSYPSGTRSNGSWSYLGASTLVPPRGLLVIYGYSRRCLGEAALWAFIFTRQGPLPAVGRYAIEPVEDSTVYFSDPNVPCEPFWALDLGPFSNTVVTPFTGTIDITRVTPAEVEGSFYVRGAYRYGELVHCLEGRGNFRGEVVVPADGDAGPS